MPRRATAIEVPRTGISHRRAVCVAIGLLIWMFAIGARLVQLQIHQHDQLAARARNQQLSSIETAATRGQVLDRQGRELARSLDTESFYADPSEIKNVERDRAVALLRSPVRTGLNWRAVCTTRRRQTRNLSGSFGAWKWTERHKLDALELDGVYSRREPKRYYPNDSPGRARARFCRAPMRLA